MDEKEIRRRESILKPDCLIVQNRTLFAALDVFQRVKPKGYVLINSTMNWDDLGIADKVSHLPERHVVGINATALAKEHVGRPVPNAALLGGFAAISGVMTLEAVEKAVNTKFDGKIAAGNVAAVRVAHAATLGQELENA